MDRGVLRNKLAERGMDWLTRAALMLADQDTACQREQWEKELYPPPVFHATDCAETINRHTQKIEELKATIGMQSDEITALKETLQVTRERVLELSSGTDSRYARLLGSLDKIVRGARI